jgi:hypothetical protein
VSHHGPPGRRRTDRRTPAIVSLGLLAQASDSEALDLRYVEEVLRTHARDTEVDK